MTPFFAGSTGPLSGIWIYMSDLEIGGHNQNISSGRVRPAVSLSNEVLYSSGNGTIDNPFIIK